MATWPPVVDSTSAPVKAQAPQICHSAAAAASLRPLGSRGKALHLHGAASAGAKPNGHAAPAPALVIPPTAPPDFVAIAACTLPPIAASAAGTASTLPPAPPRPRQPPSSPFAATPARVDRWAGPGAAAGDPPPPNPLKLRRAGFGSALLPIVRPGGRIHPSSKLKPNKLGKVPGQLIPCDRDGSAWVGFPGWETAPPATREDMLAWVRWQANLGLQTAAFPTLDVDVDDPDLLPFIGAVQALAREELGAGPQRCGRFPKLAIVYRSAVPLPKVRLMFRRPGAAEKQAVELLGAGQQVVIAGTHPCGEPYRWDVPLDRIGASGLSEVTAEKVDSFFGRLKDLVVEHGLELISDADTAANAGAEDVDQATLACADPDYVEALVRALGNTDPDFADVLDWLRMTRAIKASLRDYPERARALFDEWASPWDGVGSDGTIGNPPDRIEADWKRMTPPHKVGIGWIEAQAYRTKNAAAIELVEERRARPRADAAAGFDVIEDETMQDTASRTNVVELFPTKAATATMADLLYFAGLLGRDAADSDVDYLVAEAQRAAVKTADRDRLLRAIQTATKRKLTALRDRWAALADTLKQETPALDGDIFGPGNSDDAEPLSPAAARMMERYVWVQAVKRFYDVKTGDLLDDKQLNIAEAVVGNPINWALCAAAVHNKNAARMKRIADACTYRPNRKPLLIEHRDGRTIRCANRWRPSELVPPDRPVTDEDAQPWLDLMCRLIPDPVDLGRVLDWLAFTLQKPEVKINHGLLFISPGEGVGKGIMLRPIIAGLGAHNAVEINGGVIGRNFNSWADCRKLVIVDEIEDRHGRKADELKTYLTAPPDTIEINRKNIDAYSIPNIINMVFFSNRHDAIKITAQDRRFLVIEIRAAPLDHQESTAYQNWLNGEGTALVVGWLRQRDLAHFRPYQKAPATAAKAELVEVGQSPLRSYVTGFLDTRRYDPALAVTTAEELLVLMLADPACPPAIKGRELTADRIGHVLRALPSCRRWSMQVRLRGANGQRLRSRPWITARGEMIQRCLDRGWSIAAIYERFHGVDDKAVRRRSRGAIGSEFD